MPTLSLHSRQRFPRRCRSLGLPTAALLIILVPLSSARADEVEAIASKVSRDYVRKKAADGSFVPETYAFGEGANWAGARADFTADRLKFLEVAHAVAIPLATQHYYPTSNAATTRLLIMVYWGTTQPPDSGVRSATTAHMQDSSRMQTQAAQMLKDATKPAERRAALQLQSAADNEMAAATASLYSENQRQEEQDVRTVALLGYDSWWKSAETAMSGAAFGGRKADMFNELEEERYFVVLMAFDFPLLAQKKQSKLLWETHLSIRAASHAFDRSLAQMLAGAARYLGQDSNGLRHDPLPEGKVELGPVKDLGVVPEK